MNLRTMVQETIQKAHSWAMENQYPEGCWQGTVRMDAAIEAEYIMLNYFLGTSSESQTKKLAKAILDHQSKDGSWGKYFDAPGDVSVSILCYFALKLAGIDGESPNMVKAREFILSKGLEKLNVRAQFFLALFEQWPWRKMPVFLPEIILLPTWFPINIYEFANATRIPILSIALVYSQKPICPIPEYAKITELMVEKPQPFSLKSMIKNNVLKLPHLYDRLPWKPGRKRAIKKVLDWLIDHQEVDGVWPRTPNFALIALKTMGYSSTDPLIARGIEKLNKDCSYEVHGGLYIQPLISSNWDTGLMVHALLASGIPADSPAIKRAIHYLTKNQIKTKGDWQVKCPKGKPGAWAFEPNNTYYPDIDDTAVPLRSLTLYRNATSDQDRELNDAIERGSQWILAMQCKNGAWGTFDKDATKMFLTEILEEDVVDPPSIDVTANAIWALTLFGYTLESPRIKSALKYLFAEQEKDGSWFGHWAVNYIFGTFRVMTALDALHFDMSHPAVQHAMEWLSSKQNSDGGWGESCASYVSLEDRGKGPSTASQTAWALLALMYGGKADSLAVQKGIEYLCKTFPEERIWNEPYFTAVAVSGYSVGPKNMDKLKNDGKELPKSTMFRYDLYRFYWPLWALGKYQQLCIAHDFKH